MKRSKLTYGQLDEVLRSLGFSCGLTEEKPPTRVYQHPKRGATIMIPAFPKKDRVYLDHLAAARLEVEDFGIAAPAEFDSKFPRTG